MSSMAQGGGRPASAGAKFGRRRSPDNFHAQVIRTLGSAIVSGRYAENDLLPGDADLIDQFGVSRTVLREALKTLSAKGLIEARARVGTRVLPRARWNMFDSDVLSWHLDAGVTLELLKSLAEVRSAVEPEAAALAAVRRSSEQVESLLFWVDQMAQPGQTSEEFALKDLEFHKAVAVASGNPFMVSLSAVVEVALTASFTISSPIDGSVAFDKAIRLHRNIAEAIAEQEPDSARVAMRQAIQSGIDRASEALGADDA